MWWICVQTGNGALEKGQQHRCLRISLLIGCLLCAKRQTHTYRSFKEMPRWTHRESNPHFWKTTETAMFYANHLAGSNHRTSLAGVLNIRPHALSKRVGSFSMRTLINPITFRTLILFRMRFNRVQAPKKENENGHSETRTRISETCRRDDSLPSTLLRA
jgi:hypothetical protein